MNGMNCNDDERGLIALPGHLSRDRERPGRYENKRKTV